MVYFIGKLHGMKLITFEIFILAFIIINSLFYLTPLPFKSIGLSYSYRGDSASITLYTYTTNISNDSFFDQNIFVNISYHNSFYCSLTPKAHYKSQSTRKDAIFSEIQQLPTKSFNFIRYLRTINCQATIFIFLPSELYNFLITTEHYKIVSQCHCKFINMSGIKPEIKKRKLHTFNGFRWIVLNSFLNLYSSYFDRCCHLNIETQHFQSDPFSEFINPEYMYGKVNYNGINDSYLQNPNYSISYEQWQYMFGQVISEQFQYLSLPTIDPDFWMAKSTIFSKMTQIVVAFFLENPELGKFSNTYDYGLFGLLYYRGVFERSGIYVKLLRELKFGSNITSSITSNITSNITAKVRSNISKAA